MARWRTIAATLLALVAGVAILFLPGAGAASLRPSPGPQTPTPTPTTTPEVCCEVERRISLALEGHLSAEGRVTPRGICSERVPVKVQRKGSDGWRTVEKAVTERDGRFLIQLQDRPGRYRGVARPVGRGIDTFCLRAISKVDSHRH